MTLKIGIPAQNHDDKFGVNINYLEFIYQLGHPVIINPIEKEDFFNVYKIDALLLPGGADVDSKRYAKMPSLANYPPNIHLEHFDKEILPLVVGNMPIFGICRGLQTLNVFFGGTLQNLIWHPYSSHETHEVHQVIPYNNGNKPQKFNSKETPKFGVNSFHHQAVNKLYQNFKIEAESEYGGVIEAISYYEKKIAAVQWHPERLLDNYSLKLFQSILR
jgi:putative glutamine amidotransferase